MYGFFVNSILEAIGEKFGEGVLETVKFFAGIDQQLPFPAHEQFSETLVPDVIAAAQKVTGLAPDELMSLCGVHFVKYIRNHDHKNLVPVLGRHLADFLNGLDNLHEYMRYSYPKMSPPSFFCSQESRDGLVLRYRSKRKGYMHYVIGQLRQVALEFYSTNIDVEVVSEIETDELTDAVLRLKFVNFAHECSGSSTHIHANHPPCNLAHKEPAESTDSAHSHICLQSCNSPNVEINKSFDSAQSHVNYPLCNLAYRELAESTDSALSHAHPSSCNLASTDINESSDSAHSHAHERPYSMCGSTHNDVTDEPSNSSSPVELRDVTCRSPLSLVLHQSQCNLALCDTCQTSCNSSHSHDISCNQSYDDLNISSQFFLDAFPFHILFDRSMIIRNIGSGLEAILPGIVGQILQNHFRFTRPLTEPTLENILTYTNNVFELRYLDGVKIQRHEHGNQLEGINEHEKIYAIDEDEEMMASSSSSSGFCSSLSLCNSLCCHLTLKGTMLYVFEWDSVVFIATPTMKSLKQLFETGLYINDLSMHDFSRDLLLSGIQCSAELKQALDQEQKKNRELEESMEKLDVEMTRINSLLYQMIPQSVADRLRNGEHPSSTYQVFDSVTILFSDVVDFTRICSLLSSPMDVVNMLNSIYTQFDCISEKHSAYKVVTIGDAYMVVTGAPIVTDCHAQLACEMARDMISAITQLKNPTTAANMRIRIGIHSGSVVAGVVGLKMPRYCLFGETVNIASLMETHGRTMKIQISEATKEHLDRSAPMAYIVIERHSSENKLLEHGIKKTFWLIGRSSPDIG